MALLSRSAESLFWLGRYVERAENTARLLDVTYHGRLEPGASTVAGAVNTWEALIRTLGATAGYSATGLPYDEPPVVAYLTVDPGNGSSIVSSLGLARENARSVRDFLSSEAWTAINRLYHTVHQRNLHLIMADGLYEFCDEVRHGAQFFQGTVDATSLRDDGWHWLKSGIAIERADMLTRIVDAKYHLLLDSVDEVGGTFDRFQWMALLRSVSAFEAFRRTHAPGFEHTAILEFLVFSPDFPRSLRASVDHLHLSLDKATAGAQRRQRNSVLGLVATLQARLTFESADSLIASGLHEFMEEARSTLGEIATRVSQAFFWADGNAA
ncbi:MAG: alpha-E domain-containing protein [Dehalococcoidia bacterium]